MDNKLSKYLFKTINVIYFVIFVLLFYVLLFKQDIVYSCKLNTINNIVLLIIGIVIFVLMYLLLNRFIKEKNNSFLRKYKMIFITLLVFVIQIVITYNYYFYTGWDPEAIFIGSSELAHGSSISNVGYFSTYPNNYLIVNIYMRIIKIVHLINHDYEYYVLIILNCLINSISSFLTYSIIKKLTNKESISIFAYIIYVLLIGLSPYNVIPYSDSLCLIFPVLIIYIYLIDCRDNTIALFIKYLVLGILSYVCLKLKPQAIIPFIALFIYLLITLRKELYKKYIVGILSLFIGLLSSTYIINKDINKIWIDIINENNEIGYMHYIAMGLNKDTNGVYSIDDFWYTMNHFQYERNSKNIERIKERIKEFGVNGLIDHSIRKALTNFNDGTFAYSLEGNFFKETIERNNSLSYILNNYYSLNNQREYYSYFLNISKTIWITILFFCLLSFFQKDNKSTILKVILIGIILFEMIFEARARYIYIMVPIFIIVGSMGLDNIISMFYKKYYKC